MTASSTRSLCFLAGSGGAWAGGRRALLVWALAENPFRGFYLRLGGAPVFEREIVIEGQALREIGYGWPDIHDLIAHVPREGAEDEMGG